MSCFTILHGSKPSKFTNHWLTGTYGVPGILDAGRLGGWAGATFAQQATQSRVSRTSPTGRDAPGGLKNAKEHSYRDYRSAPPKNKGRLMSGGCFVHASRRIRQKQSVASRSSPGTGEDLCFNETFWTHEPASTVNGQRSIGRLSNETRLHVRL